MFQEGMGDAACASIGDVWSIWPNIGGNYVSDRPASEAHMSFVTHIKSSLDDHIVHVELVSVRHHLCVWPHPQAVLVYTVPVILFQSCVLRFCRIPESPIRG